MTVEVEPAGRATADLSVSGIVIRVLLRLVQAGAGDVGLAKALALADEQRSFPALVDTGRRTPLAEAVALFNAAALVTGDPAVGLHVGEEVLWSHDAEEEVDEIRSLGSPGGALHRVTSLLHHLATGSEAVVLDVAPGHGLVQVTPQIGEVRHAHLCELTRGILTELPALFGLEPALVTEHECSARGGRSCRYSVRWAPADAVTIRDTAPPSATDQTSVDPSDGAPVRPPPARGDQRVTTITGAPAAEDVARGGGRTGAELERAGAEADLVRREADRVHAEAEEARAEADQAKEEADRVRQDAERVRAEAEEAEEARDEADRVKQEADRVRFEAEEARAEADRAKREADRVRAEADHTVARLADDAQRLEWLLEGASATTLEVLDQDVEGVLGELRGRADRLVSTDRFLFMVRVGPGMPIELHHRGLGDDEAEHLATEVWRESPDDAGGTRLIVDIASPRRRYGRLAEFFEPGTPRPEGEERRLGLFARYAANALDVLTVVREARRSDATARALLSFSEELSGMSRLGDAVQTLADTVPAVTGCDLATVYLWDESACQLVPRALSDANRTPSSYLGPIVPLGSDGRPLGSRRPEWTDAASVEADGFVAVQRDDPTVQRMLEDREILVIDGSVEDPQLRDLMTRTKAHAAVVAPLFGAGTFLGVIVATFAEGTAPSVVHDPDLHERLSGLADQAATTIQNLALVERVSHMAWHDALTGLPNRRLFEDRVEQELVRSRRVGEPVCMFFVDLDNFKTVNDTYGHATGDELILQVAQRLVGTVRSQDTVARVGGDEFAILLPGLSDQFAINLLAERTLDAMHTPFVIFGTEVTTSASIGIAIAPEHGDSYDDLLNRADEAMYRAKDLGRNAFEMYRNQPDPDRPGRRALDDRELYADLIKALDSNEFFLLYQPYIDLRTAHVVGVEALIRWDHPTLGILEPSYFIDLAEKSDLIVALDSWVLWQACRQLRAWIDHDLGPLRLSVNLASRDLSNPDLFASIQRTLNETSIDPTLLELEITERVVLDKSGPARDNIDQLRRLGVRFTIDDFGSGNSSLNRIGTFPVSTLKIDQSFVHVLGPDGENNSLVSAIISMADRLGLACVAEGVETSLQSRVLLQRGCTTAQGYYFSPPLPPEDVERMMRSIVPAEVPEDFAAPSDTPDGWDETAE